MKEPKKPSPKSEIVGKGKRRPRPDDIVPVLQSIAEGKSLRTACSEFGINAADMDDLLYASEDNRLQYMRAKEQRADVLAERALTLSMAAATGGTYEGRKIEANGARVALDAIKWAAGKMAPKTYGEKQQLEISGQVDIRAWLLSLGEPKE